MSMRSLLSSVVLALFLSGHAVSALDVTFHSAADVEDNFKIITGKAAISFADEDGGVLRFTTADKLTFARIALANRQGNFLGLKEGTVEVTFRFRDHLESFGVLLRVRDNDSKAYLCLVNLNESQSAALRIFKVTPLDTPNETNILNFKSSKTVSPNEWYRLRVKMKNVGKDGVEVEAELLPEDGSGALMTGTVKDTSDTILGEGQIHLRMYSSNIPCEIDVKRVEVSPSPSVVR